MKLKLFNLNQPLEKTFFYIPRISLSFLGFWPRQKVTFVLIILKIINFLWLCYGASIQLIFGYVHIKDLLLALDAICPALTEVVTVIKLLTFILYRKRLKIAIEKLYEITKMVMTRPESLKVYNENHLTATIIAGGVLFFANFTNFSYSLRPLVNGATQYFRKQNVTIEMPFRAELPEFLTTELPYLPITFLTLSYSGVVTVFGFSGADGFLVGYCHYVSAVFKILQLDIKETFSHLKNADQASQRDNIVIKRKLGRMVLIQNELIGVCKELTSIYSFIIISHFVSSAVIMGLSLLDLMMNSGFGIVLYVNYSAAVLVQLLTYCVGGSSVIDSSFGISQTLYDVEWYKCNKSTQKMILFLIMRAQDPTTIAVPFFSPSMEVFGTVMSSVGSYVTLLKTFL